MGIFRTSARRFDILVYLLALSILTQIIALVTTSLDLGKPFDGLINTYDPVSGQYRVNPSTPLWWANTVQGQFHAQDKLLTINERPYRYAPYVIRQAWIEGAESVTITLEREGVIMEQHARILIFDGFKYVDFFVPSALIAVCLWLIALAIFSANPNDRGARLVVYTLVMFSLASSTNRAPLLTHRGMLYPLGNLLTDILVVFECVVYVHAILYLTRNPAEDRFRRAFVGIIYTFGMGTTLSNGALTFVLWTQGWNPSLGQAFQVHNLVTNFLIIFTPIILCARLGYFLWSTRRSAAANPEDFRMSKVAVALLIGTALSLLSLLPRPLSRLADHETTSFWMYLDFRMFALLPALMLATTILRYQTFNARTRVIWLIPVIIAAAFTTGLVRAVFLAAQPQPFQSEVVVPSLGIFFLLFGLSLLWLYQSSLRGLYGRILYRERRELRDVSIFARHLVELASRGAKPEQAVAEAVREQYLLEYVVIWKLHADIRGDIHFERAASEGIYAALGSEPKILPLMPLDDPDMDLKAVRLNVPNKLPHPYYLPLRNNAAAEVAIPLIFAHRPVALMVVGKRRDQEILDNLDLEVLSLIAQQGALFMEAQRVKERFTRIGDILHDTTQQFLYRLTLELTLIMESMEDNSSDSTVLLQLENLLGDVYENSDVLRQISSGKFQPGFMDLPRLIESLGRRYALKIDYEFEVEEYIPLELQEEMYLWLRETLNNIIKHAHAQNVSVSLIQEGTELVLKVCDDGQGFTPHLGITKPRKGGLDRVRNRIERFNGNLDMVSLHPGTQITIRIPLVVN